MTDIKTFHIIWDDIVFKKDQIEFSPKRIKTILKPVKVKGVIESLNIIKGEYFNRLYGKKAFKLSFENGLLLQSKENSPGWIRLMDAVELVQEYYAIKFQKRIKGAIRKNSKLNEHEILDVYEDLLSKTEYLKFLAQRINTEFKLIPVLEYSNGNVEDSFLFRFRNNRGDVLIVWENVNSGRATYIFKYNEQRHEDVLQKIEAFICSQDYTHKRSLLSDTDRVAKNLKKELCFFKKYTHKGYSEFKAEIEYIIGYS